jgi:hypothetical protein
MDFVLWFMVIPHFFVKLIAEFFIIRGPARFSSARSAPIFAVFDVETFGVEISID